MPSMLATPSRLRRMYVYDPKLCPNKHDITDCNPTRPVCHQYYQIICLNKASVLLRTQKLICRGFDSVQEIAGYLRDHGDLPVYDLVETNKKG